jgi:hypothetical protein
MQTDRLTDMTKLIATFRNFAIAPENFSDKSYRKSQNTLFVYNNFFPKENIAVHEKM